jgi:hypothetical protein
VKQVSQPGEAAAGEEDGRLGAGGEGQHEQRLWQRPFSPSRERLTLSSTNPWNGRVSAARARAWNPVRGWAGVSMAMQLAPERLVGEPPTDHLLIFT